MCIFNTSTVRLCSIVLVHFFAVPILAHNIISSKHTYYTHSLKPRIENARYMQTILSSNPTRCFCSCIIHPPSHPILTQFPAVQIPPLVLRHSLIPPLLNIVARVRPSRSTHLFLADVRIDLLYIDQLFDAHDLTGDGLRDGVIDGGHAFAETERFKHTLHFLRHADAGAHQGYTEVGHSGGEGEVDEEMRWVGVQRVVQWDSDKLPRRA